jgi:hypothetical protein
MTDTTTNPQETARDEDAVHVLAPGDREHTLCGLTLDGHNAVRFLDWFRVDWGAGCWSCLTRAMRR